jgi:hypothetical protein
MARNQLIRLRGRQLLAAAAALVAATALTPAADAESSGGSPDVVWTEPSSGVAGSMPLGNGRLGVNVWSESEAELALLLSHVDALDENAVLSKIGRLRLVFGRPTTAAAAARANGSSWRASYFSRNATAAFVLGDVRVRVWVDALQPVVHVESDGGPHALTVTLELWRNTTTEFFNFTGDEVDGRWCGARFVHPDTIVPDPQRQRRQLAWYHRNLPAWTGVVEADMRRQGLTTTSSNPLNNVTFGAIASLAGGTSADRSPRALHAATSDHHQLAVTADAFVATSSEAFLARLQSEAAKPRDDAAHRAAWEAFWSRSWINVTASPSTVADPSLAAAAANVTLLSNLNRLGFAVMANSTAAHAIKFNGYGIFSVGIPTKYVQPKARQAACPAPWGCPGTEDTRPWGSDQWFQNIRLPYYSMLQVRKRI